MYLCICEKAAENGAFGGCFLTSFPSLPPILSQGTSSTFDLEMDFSRSLMGHGSRYMWEEDSGMSELVVTRRRE